MIGANGTIVAGENGAKRKLLLSGYLSSVKTMDTRKRYLAKLYIIGRIDPYETEKEAVERRHKLVAKHHTCECGDVSSRHF